MFQMHRVFCATPWEMGAERDRFYDTIGRFNESTALGRGVLYVPVALPNTFDKRPLQSAVEENIRDCTHYILLLLDGWGPPERNFREDYYLAQECVDDIALPMRSVAILAKKRPWSPPLPEGTPTPIAEFATAAEFDECIERLLSGWLEACDQPASAGAP
jgi:hypothetical protein